MPITTHMHPAIAVTKADLVYDANDDLGYPITCFFNIDASYEYPDRSVGFAGGWECTAKLIGCQIGNLVLGENDAHNALDRDAVMLERVAAEWEADRRNDEGGPRKMNALTYMPNLDEAFRRMNERAAAANIATDRAEAIAKAKRVIDDPRGYSDEQLREVCAAFMAMNPTPAELADGWGVYYLRADTRIFEINLREWQARNCPRPETSAQVFARHWRKALPWAGVWAVVILALTGWLF